jgi:hypothetical protein
VAEWTARTYPFARAPSLSIALAQRTRRDNRGSTCASVLHALPLQVARARDRIPASKHGMTTAGDLELDPRGRRLRAALAAVLVGDKAPELR